jgi:single-stranded-DNA-specific exonuclease
VRAFVTPADLELRVETDGSLAPDDLTFETVRTIGDCVWGQGFPEPRFCDTFDVLSQRAVAGQHLKVRLEREGRAYDGMIFGETGVLPQRVEAVYRVELNEFNGTLGLSLTLAHWRPV